MLNASAARFRFISHALNCTGPFRPTVSYTSDGKTANIGTTYLVRYPRESDEKFARRNELAFFESPLARHTSRFVGYIAEKPPQREAPHQLYAAMVADADGKGNSLDVFWQDFMVNAKARGSMLLLVDMPRQLPASLGGQIQQRAAPFLTAITPEIVTDYALGDDGRFTWVEFSGTVDDAGTTVACTWRFDRSGWQAKQGDGRIITQGTHSLGVCPVLIFTESGDFPCFGSFATIADLSKRLFNLDSELDEILRAQTFSLLTMQVPPESTAEAKIEAARVVGQTVGTSNLLVHTGNSPQFIAPPDGPANIYLTRIDKLNQRIDDIGLAVSSPNSRESGISMQMRFHQINAALSKFAERMEDFERRMWAVAGAWLKMNAMPTTAWTRDYNMANVEQELAVLGQMNGNAMPPSTIVEQQKRVVALQFSNLEDEDLQRLFDDIESRNRERQGSNQPPTEPGVAA